MGPTILSIEDSIFERKAIIKLLKDEGYDDIIETGEGEEGIEKYDEEEPDLVLLDLRLPDMDGIEVLKELEERDADVIVVSIVREQDTIDETKEIGAKGYVQKPITKEKLIPKIEEILGEEE
ncbi:MAG: response regulator [Candidatus Nanohaloarchaea archaeon]